MSSWDFTLLREIWAVNHQQLLFSQLVKSPTERKCFLKKFSKHGKEELTKSSGSWGWVRMTRFFQPSCDCQAQWGVICDQWSWAGESPSPGRIAQAFACFPSCSFTKTQVACSKPSPYPGVLDQFPTLGFPNRQIQGRIESPLHFAPWHGVSGICFNRCAQHLDHTWNQGFLRSVG